MQTATAVRRASAIWQDAEPETLLEAVGRWAHEKPDQLALGFVSDGTVLQESLTYGELDRRARAVAANLMAAFEPGDRALLLYPPSLEFVTAFFGCLYAGILAVPAYPPSPRTMGRLLAIVEDARPVAILAPSAIGGAVRAGIAEHGDVTALPLVETDLLDDWSDRWERPPVTGESVAFLQYTSGSVGKPKGVVIDHRCLIANERMIEAAFGHDETLVGVSWLPLYHDMGLIGQVLQPVYLGTPGYLMSPLEFLKRPVTWLQAISHFRATTSGGPNFGYERCVRKVTPEERAGLDLSSWKVAYNGAEPLRAETFDRFAATFAESGFRPQSLYPCYGLAEATLFAAGKPPHESPVKRSFDIDALELDRRAVPALGEGSRPLVSSGRAWLDQRFVIVDPDRDVALADGEVGEIWTSGSHIAAGYWNRPEETEGTFRARPMGWEEGRFLRTGDLGFLLEGELFVTGRIKDVVIVRGRNYYPQDIERTVDHADPLVRPGCTAAFGVDVDGEEHLVVVTEIEGAGEVVDLEAVRAAIRLAVVTNHGIRAHQVVLIPRGEIPKTSSGKIQRARARELFLSGELVALIGPDDATASPARET